MEVFSGILMAIASFLIGWGIGTWIFGVPASLRSIDKSLKKIADKGEDTNT